MKYIEDAKSEQQSINQTKYDKSGNPTSKDDYYAEMIIKGNNVNYFIKTFSSTLYDPFGPYSKRESVLDLKLKKVSQQTFNTYLEYLRTKNLKHLSIAQRGFIDDRA